MNMAAIHYQDKIWNVNNFYTSIREVAYQSQQNRKM
jgi:hypothetical protein